MSTDRNKCFHDQSVNIRGDLWSFVWGPGDGVTFGQGLARFARSGESKHTALTYHRTLGEHYPGSGRTNRVPGRKEAGIELGLDPGFYFHTSIDFQEPWTFFSAHPRRQHRGPHLSISMKMRATENLP